LLSGIKVVLFFVIASALLGFTQVPIAEGAVSWNGFLQKVGFNPPSVYEVSAVSVIPAGEVREGNQVQLRCSDGDWFIHANNQPQESVVVTTGDPSLQGLDLGIFAIGNFIEESEQIVQGDNVKTIGWDGVAKRDGLDPLVDIPVTITGLCVSPSSMMTVGGEWIATDTTALIIGYSVLNAYWIAPIGIGIGVGIYLVKRRF